MIDTEWFSAWRKGLIEEDIREGIHPVNRGLKAELELYAMYKNNLKRKS